MRPLCSSCIAAGKGPNSVWYSREGTNAVSQGPQTLAGLHTPHTPHMTILLLKPAGVCERDKSLNSCRSCQYSLPGVTDFALTPLQYVKWSRWGAACLGAGSNYAACWIATSASKASRKSVLPVGLHACPLHAMVSHAWRRAVQDCLWMHL